MYNMPSRIFRQVLEVVKQNGARYRFTMSSVRCFAASRSNMADTTSKSKSAAIIVIGDEILKGQTLETNSNYLCKHLFNLGIQVKHISIIGDDIDNIASEVERCSANYGCVFTSGGVGPTHDDVTYDGVAKAFGVTLHPEPILVNMIEKYFPPDKRRTALKMADVPKTSRLLFSKGQPERYPLVAIKNVYILPGIPIFLERSFMTLMDSQELQGGIEPITKYAYISLDEVSIAPTLNRLVEKYKNKITIGSYPEVSHTHFKVRLVLQSVDQKDVDDALRILQEELPKGSVTPFEPKAVEKAGSLIYEFIKSESSAAKDILPLRQTIEVLEETFKRYSISEICVCFPGGKDCTALLYLVHAVLQKHFPNRKEKLKGAYFQYVDSFPEVEQFIKDSSKRYDLKFFEIQKSIKDGLEELLANQPEIKAILVGNRRTDPHSSNLTSFIMTDPDWPQVMRVCPLLDWSYNDVWNLLRKFSVPYCSLYDRGFTSIGSTKDSYPNPQLRYFDNEGKQKFYPAYALKDAALERSGRDKSI